MWSVSVIPATGTSLPEPQQIEVTSGSERVCEFTLRRPTATDVTAIVAVETGAQGTFSPGDLTVTFGASTFATESVVRVEAEIQPLSPAEFSKYGIEIFPYDMVGCLA